VSGAIRTIVWTTLCYAVGASITWVIFSLVDPPLARSMVWFISSLIGYITALIGWAIVIIVDEIQDLIRHIWRSKQ